MARKDKSIALRLRLQGKSYSEIRKELGVSKSTLSLWLKDVIIPDAARQRLARRTRELSIRALIARNKNQTVEALRRKTDIQNTAKAQIGKLSHNELLLIGTTLYWAEGYKRPKVVNGREVVHHPVSLTNADPILLNVFIRFLIEICAVPRKDIKIQLRIFPWLNEKAALQYWSGILKISLENFEKVCICISKSSQGKRPFNRLPYGVAQVRINSTNLFHQIMGWIGGIKENS